MQSAREKGNVEERDWNVLNIVEVFVFMIVSFSANRIAVVREIYCLFSAILFSFLVSLFFFLLLYPYFFGFLLY